MTKNAIVAEIPGFYKVIALKPFRKTEGFLLIFCPRA